MSPRAFARWLAAAPRGAAVTYYRGLLGRDRHADGPLDDRARRRLGALADAVRGWADSGHVCLVQVRHGPETYSYRAIRTARRLTPIPAGAATRGRPTVPDTDTRPTPTHKETAA